MVLILLFYKIEALACIKRYQTTYKTMHNYVRYKQLKLAWNS